MKNLVDAGIKNWEIWAEAYQAGVEAGQAAQVDSMTVYASSGKQYHVSEGVCGFAWLEIRGNTSFGKWALKEGIASKLYSGGLRISCREFGQSMQRKEAFIWAARKHLEAAGIACHGFSRMD